MKTKKPIAIVYGWDRVGEFDLTSDVYYWEGLQDSVKVYSFDKIDLKTHFTVHNPDLIISIGKEITTNLESLNGRIMNLDTIVPDNVYVQKLIKYQS
jgi:hypothetical protein